MQRDAEVDYYPDDEAAARGLVERRGLTAQQWDRYARERGWPHSATVARRLGHGSWEQAVTAADLGRRPRRAWSTEQVIALLRADAYKRGRPPRAPRVADPRP